MNDPNPASCPQQLDIDSLVQLARRNDPDAFNELMRRHDGAVRRTAYSILKNLQDAEDAAQETYLRVVEKLNTFEGASKFSTWLTRIAINTSLMRLRRQRSRPAFSLEELTDGDASSFPPLADPRLDPEEQFCSANMRARLNEAVRNLPSHLREVAEDQIYAELPIKDSADRRGITVAAAKSRAHRARRLLIGALQPPPPQLHPFRVKDEMATK
ncbi:RNA polymerase sigma-70 factor, ECF subfamily [Bryocella elongata]|uniref:RNA polymerase sigma-70 factor, ECF subfamily n=1 Tax=Bryocella elongata TaxID=863522 RepID=A0A1H6BS60_9BACT|nr:sigma-70 family RNA polymerase sigma factor [Bryocella elongata]SEG63549.1 RNA polymerase sigma-70 factor, ECF subfamily [Bryocella elongata]